MIDATHGKYSNYNKPCYPNWIITDWRFENEGKAIELRDGIKIRVERDIKFRYPERYKQCKEFHNEWHTDIPDNIVRSFINTIDPKLHSHLTHQSETELDKYVGTDYFKYCIYNNGSIEDLIKQCEDILIKEKLI